MVGFDVELLGELPIDGFNDLADRIDEPFRCALHGLFLIASR